MPTSAFTAAALAARTDKILVGLITLSHPNMGTPIRVTTDSVQTVSNGNAFIPFPFNFNRVRSSESAPPTGRLTINNIDRRIVLAVRALPLEPALDVLIQTVLASDPNIIEEELAGLQMRNIEFDAFHVSGDLLIDALDREPFPSVRFLPSTFPGCF
jgi:hypothetical protein